MQGRFDDDEEEEEKKNNDECKIECSRFNCSLASDTKK